MSPKKIKIVDISPEQNNDIEPAIEHETPTIDPDNTEIQPPEEQHKPAVIEGSPPNEEEIKTITEDVEEAKKQR